MKLARVAFSHQVTVPGYGTAAEFDSQAIPLEYDRATDMVRIGNDGAQEDVPKSSVVQWRRDRTKENAKQTCDVCQRQFNNRQALGAHKRFRHE